MTALWVLDDRWMATLSDFVQHVLAPMLRRGDVVVLDNLPAHKVAGIGETIAERRAQISTCRPTAPI